MNHAGPSVHLQESAPPPHVPMQDGPCADPRLDAPLLAAHGRHDGHALVGLYAAAADRSDGVARAFYLTHAYIYALEQGDDRAASLKAALVEIGADTA